MRRFLAQVALFGLLQAAVFAAVCWVSARRTDDYLAASLDKERRLATLPGPRVVFVGGSNLAFGLDAAVIERHTGRRPVNMGLYVAVGVPFMLEEARAGLRPGDVVVVALEYYVFSLESHLNGDVLDWPRFFEVNPLAARYAPGRLAGLAAGKCEDGLGMLGQVVHAALRPGRARVAGDYARHNFNEAGDVKTPRERRPDAPPLQPHEVTPAPAVAARAAALLERFVADCRRRGVAVYLAMPAYPRSHWERQAAVLGDIEAVLRRRVSAPLLVTAEEAALPDDRFYDTPYHLTTQGAAERSELLGRRLAEALAGREERPPSP